MSQLNQRHFEILKEIEGDPEFDSKKRETTFKEAMDNFSDSIIATMFVIEKEKEKE